jgi:hypothetical protein
MQSLCGFLNNENIDMLFMAPMNPGLNLVSCPFGGGGGVVIVVVLSLLFEFNSRVYT